MKLFSAFTLIVLFSLPMNSRALTLGEGLKTVVDGGRDVTIARSYEDAARSTVSLARSPWLPTLDVYARETWLQYEPAAKLPFSIPGAPSSIPQSQDQFLTYGVKATQILYDFGKTSSSIGAARFGLRSREIETSRTRNLSALEFITTYLDLLEADKLLQVANEEVLRYEAHKKDTESRYKAGVVTKNEVLQVDVTLADSRQRALIAQNSRSLKASKINSLIMKPLSDPVQPEEIKQSPAAGIRLEDAWAAAETGNEDLRDLDAQIAAKEEQVRMVRAEYLPTFYVTGGYEYSENKYTVHEDSWSVIAGVTMNLASGGASSSRLQIAKSEARSLKLTREKTLDAVRLQAQAAYLDVQSSLQRIDVTKTAVDQAQENLRLQRLRYREGVGTATDVLDAVTLLSTAESNSWKALYGLKRAEASLLYSMGRDLATTYRN
ncbi:MAG TPA: TolC family protein [Nitrospirota bacterium]|nr:TolC family protein [Nitrospirota bacterium]